MDKQTVYTCFVTNEKKTLLGFISLRTIVTNEPETLIEDLMDEDVIYVHTDDDQETVADVFKKYGFVVLPVVDNEKRLTGIITVDDIMEVMEQEATEDFQIMAGMSPDEDEYLDQSVFNLAKTYCVAFDTDDFCYFYRINNDSLRITIGTSYYSNGIYSYDNGYRRKFRFAIIDAYYSWTCNWRD